MLKDTGPANVETLRANIPELLEVAEQVGRRQVVGVAAYKPPNSHPQGEPRVFDFVGMIGLPLVPCHEFPTDAPAAFFSIHAAKAPELSGKLAALIASGRPVLITDGLAERLKEQVPLRAANVHILPVGGEPKSLLGLTEDRLNAIRRPLLRPLDRSFQAPNRVALYLFEDRSCVIENFNDEPVTVQLDGKSLTVAARGWLHEWK